MMGLYIKGGRSTCTLNWEVVMFLLRCAAHVHVVACIIGVTLLQLLHELQ